MIQKVWKEKSFIMKLYMDFFITRVVVKKYIHINQSMGVGGASAIATMVILLSNMIIVTGFPRGHIIFFTYQSKVGKYWG